MVRTSRRVAKYTSPTKSVGSGLRVESPGLQEILSVKSKSKAVEEHEETSCQGKADSSPRKIEIRFLTTKAAASKIDDSTGAPSTHEVPVVVLDKSGLFSIATRSSLDKAGIFNSGKFCSCI